MKSRLIVPNPDAAIDFYQGALAAELTERYVGNDIVVHAAMSAGSGEFSLAAEVPDWGLLAPATVGGSPILITLDVDDARRAADRMVSEGAEVVIPVEDRQYGRCEGRIRDPFGHLWIPTHQLESANTDPSDEPRVSVRRIVADLTVRETAPSIDFFRYLFDLEVVMDQGWVATLSPDGNPARQLTLMTSDASAATDPVVSIEVDDLDVVWGRVQGAGIEVVYERTVEPWGVERFFVRDPTGNVLNVLSHIDDGSVNET